MQIVKVRRVGNSNVISIPREMEALGYTPGTSVLVEGLPSGELRVVPADDLRERVREVSRDVVSRNRQALDVLAEHVPKEQP